MARLSLKWPVDVTGYRIEQRENSPRTSRAAKSISAGDPGPLIVRNGGRWEFYDAMRIDGLYRIFARCRTTADVLAFVERYGFLKASASERIELITEQVKIVRSLVSAKDACNYEAIEQWVLEDGKRIRVNPVFQANSSPQLFFQPATLLDAIYLQLLQDTATGANLRLCARPGCGAWFKFGPGTIHRNTAVYCSPKCQKAHVYAKSKGAA